MAEPTANIISPEAWPLRLLFVDDDTNDIEVCLPDLRKSGLAFTATAVTTRTEFVEALRSHGFDAIVCDYRMKTWTGMDALAHVKEICPDVPLILLSGALGDELAAQCIKLGFTDYVLKEQTVRLPTAIRRSQYERALKDAEKRALDAVRQSEEHYRGLVNNATYGICRLTADGEFLEVNPALVNMLGFASARELIALRTTHSLYCDPTAQDHLHAGLRSTGYCDATTDWRRKDGKIITVRINARLTKEGKNSGNYIEGIIENVTERLALEKQLFQAQKFEAIGQLAGGVAHDFNNMIGAILGWADLGMDECEPGSRPRQRFEKIRLQANRAAALTRQLLAFARRQVFDPRAVALNQSIVETLSLLEQVIGSNIEIRTNLAPDLKAVRSDPVQIEQVLMNLCINARDAMPDGGTLFIETSSVTFDEKYCGLQPLAERGPHVMLRVTDTGTGMDRATMERIFEPFFTTKEIGKGTGLGLATVYGIVRQHGGFVEVESEPGVGSTFRAYFPVSAADEAQDEPQRDIDAAPRGSECILMVEDHEGLRQLALETLTALGYLVLTASDGMQGLEEFHTHRNQIDLVVLDVMLPKLNGLEIYARIREERPNVPVIFATGYSSDIDMLRKVVEQDLPLLQKPYSPYDLGRKVRETLDQRAQVTSSAAARHSK